MKFKTFQECREAEGWQPVRMESSSEPGKIYTVMVNPWGADDENLCDCLGYFHRGYCKHQQMASDRICRWRDDAWNEPEQSPEQRKAKVCPKCGGPTKWQIEVEE